MHRNRLFATSVGLAIALTLSIFVSQAAQAQTYQVIHNFTAGLDGRNPETQLILDAAGNLYGTTSGRGVNHGDCSNAGCGTVFEIDLLP